MKTYAKLRTLTVSRLAYLQGEGKIYLDDAFQSNVRWSTQQKQKYIASIIEGRAITPITLGKISSLKDAVETRNGVEHEDYKYFESLLESGFDWITIDGNNRDNTVCEFLNGNFPLQKGKYEIDYNNIFEFSATDDSKYFSDLSADVRNYIENIDINVLEVKESDRRGLANLFSNINEGVPLNDQEKRNAIPSRMGNLVRELVKSNANGFSQLYSSKAINRRSPDEYVVTVSNIVARPISNIDRQSRDDAYGDDTLEVRSFDRTKKIVNQICEVSKDAGASGFKAGGKFTNNLIDFSLLLNYINSHNITINNLRGVYNFFVNSQSIRLESDKELYNNGKGTNPRTYAGLLRSNNKKFLEIRERKQIESLQDVPDGLLTFKDKDRNYDPKIRFTLWKKQGGKCAITGDDIEARLIYDGQTTHVDHVKPHSKGGETTLENAQLVFASANLQKSDKYEEVEPI